MQSTSFRTNTTNQSRGSGVALSCATPHCITLNTLRVRLTHGHVFFGIDSIQAYYLRLSWLRSFVTHAVDTCHPRRLVCSHRFCPLDVPTLLALKLCRLLRIVSLSLLISTASLSVTVQITKTHYRFHRAFQHSQLSIQISRLPARPLPCHFSSFVTFTI